MRRLVEVPGRTASMQKLQAMGTQMRSDRLTRSFQKGTSWNWGKRNRESFRYEKPSTRLPQ